MTESLDPLQHTETTRENHMVRVVGTALAPVPVLVSDRQLDMPALGQPPINLGNDAGRRKMMKHKSRRSYDAAMLAATRD